MQLDYLIHQALGMPRWPPSRGYQLSPVWSDRRQIGEAISVETQGFGAFNITGLRIGAPISAEKHRDKSGKVLSSLIWTVVKECHLSESSL
jgi:hypothetical protein